ncbi:MAG: diadenylate cyclase CdaA [Anaerovoracaceae bacterium]|jgi:diadenylate cyclase
MQAFILDLIQNIRINDVIDIGVTTFILYKILNFIQETRAQQLVRGLIFIVAFYFIAGFFELHTLHWILGGAFTMGLFALVVIFQPEVRRALEVMGRSRWSRNSIAKMYSEQAKRIIDEITSAVDEFSRTKTGALIVFERESTLEDIAETGTIIDARISDQLLGNLFYEGSPLHDGAVIIRGNKIHAAGCVLPLTENKNLSKSLGTRHRAGIGITENSDCLTLIVSEETGVISIAQDGKLRRFLDKRAVEKELFQLYIKDEEEPSGIRRLFSGRGGGERHE